MFRKCNEFKLYDFRAKIELIWVLEMYVSIKRNTSFILQMT